MVLAASIGRMDKAYELYLRTSRLDLDDYNHEADEGLHITSMAGTWLSLVEGMAGVRITESGLSITPKIPSVWNSYAFHIRYKDQPLRIEIHRDGGKIENLGSSITFLTINNQEVKINSNEAFNF